MRKEGLWKIPSKYAEEGTRKWRGKRTGIIRKMAILLPFVIAFCMLALRLFRVALIPCFVDRSLPDGRRTTHVRLCVFLENRKTFFFFGSLWGLDLEKSRLFVDDIKKARRGKKLKRRIGAVWGDDVACDVWETLTKVNVRVSLYYYLHT